MSNYLNTLHHVNFIPLLDPAITKHDIYVKSITNKLGQLRNTLLNSRIKPKKNRVTPLNRGCLRFPILPILHQHGEQAFKTQPVLLHTEPSEKQKPKQPVAPERTPRRSRQLSVSANKNVRTQSTQEKTFEIPPVYEKCRLSRWSICEQESQPEN